jgi:S-adenosylmethionine:tRNA ribosyltransferase-isomerase
MLLSDFDYELPDDLIARYPMPERRASRLLVVGSATEDRGFKELPTLLKTGDLLVFNDTRVIRARLRGTKKTGGRVEILIERQLSDTEALAQIKASKAPKPESVINFAGGCIATVSGREGDMFTLRFNRSLAPFLERYGEIPLPPYLNRHEEAADDERYQTVYAKLPGAVAAPTAGLHFDLSMLDETRAMGVRHAYVTLHVGAGTYQPLRKTQVEANRLHAERVEVGDSVCDAVRETRAAGGRVVAVGTTSVRALEAASASGMMQPFMGETDIFIFPGYRFRSVDMLLTNFHLPKSSLLMLVAAFAGYDTVMSAYQYAVSQRYRFFSYGDAMLLLPDQE